MNSFFYIFFCFLASFLFYLVIRLHTPMSSLSPFYSKPLCLRRCSARGGGALLGAETKLLTQPEPFSAPPHPSAAPPAAQASSQHYPTAPARLLTAISTAGWRPRPGTRPCRSSQALPRGTRPWCRHRWPPPIRADAPTPAGGCGAHGGA